MNRCMQVADSKEVRLPLSLMLSPFPEEAKHIVRADAVCNMLHCALVNCSEGHVPAKQSHEVG